MSQRALGGFSQPSRREHAHAHQGLHRCSQRRRYCSRRRAGHQRRRSKARLACFSCRSHNCSHLPQLPAPPPSASPARRHAQRSYSLLFREIGMCISKPQLPMFLLFCCRFCILSFAWLQVWTRLGPFFSTSGSIRAKIACCGRLLLLCAHFFTELRFPEGH